LIPIVPDNSNSKLPITDQQKQWLDEYHTLTEDQKKDFVARFDEKTANQPKTRRPDTRGRIQDVSRTITNIENMVSAFLFIVLHHYLQSL
jgi:hypothetical protein